MGEFTEYLDKIGISKSRQFNLELALDSLHRALAYMDSDNRKCIEEEGLINIMRTYCKVEHLADVSSCIGGVLKVIE